MTQPENKAPLPAATAGSGDEPFIEMTILQWNVQGLLPAHLHERTVETANEINTLQPDVVMMQEIVADSLSYFRNECPNYQLFTPSDFKTSRLSRYFTVLMVHQSTFKVKSKNLINFPSSVQGRDLLIVSGTCRGRKVTVMTSHLESTIKSAEERIQQLIKVCEVMKQEPSSHSVIYGGDTNLRDSEVVLAKTKSGALSNSIDDIWEILGCPADTEFTWDTQINDNLPIHDNPDGSRTRLRLDRLYMRKDSSERQSHFHPSSMKLVGTNRHPCGLFPSDHWGLLVTMRSPKKQSKLKAWLKL